MGFREGRGCADQMALKHDLCKVPGEGEELFTAFMETKGAYDKVHENVFVSAWGNVV